MVTVPATQCAYTLYDSNGIKIRSYHFDHWNTAKDDSGLSYAVNASLTLAEDMVLYAIYKAAASQPSGDYIDISATSSYEMAVGDSVQLWSEDEDSYSILSGSEYVSLSDSNVLSATNAGTAIILCVSAAGTRSYLTVTVNPEEISPSQGTPSALIVGTWDLGKEAIGRYLEFYTGGTGKAYMTAETKNNYSSFNWAITESNGTVTLKMTGNVINTSTITLTATTLWFSTFCGVSNLTYTRL